MEEKIEFLTNGKSAAENYIEYKRRRSKEIIERAKHREEELNAAKLLELAKQKYIDAEKEKRKFEELNKMMITFKIQ
ncbi:MAG: hypothetical protein MJ237_09125 [bacterium]|nr:hypothetical protein [bacterium]